MTTEGLEELFRRADFTVGSRLQETLRDRLFRQRPQARVLRMNTGAENRLGDEALALVAAAGEPSSDPGRRQEGCERRI